MVGHRSIRRARMPEKDCQYGVLGFVCGRSATTKRQRPAGGTWEVCEAHAAFLDRLRENITKHAPLLERLRTGGEADG